MFPDRIENLNWMRGCAEIEIEYQKEPYTK